MIPLTDYLIVAGLLLIISMVGLLINRNNLIALLMCIELLLLAVNINFLAFARYFNQTAGDVFVFFILTVAAAESAIGLAILVNVFRQQKRIDVDSLTTLKG